MHTYFFYLEVRGFMKVFFSLFAGFCRLDFCSEVIFQGCSHH